MKKLIIAAALALIAPLAFAADARYTLTEYTMDGCGACVAALKDVDELIEQGFDVRVVNTDRDPQAAREAARYRLPVRPAWRLARADGAEVGRWFGANRAGIIAATIRAKFPTPDEEIPVAPDPIGTPDEEEQTPKEPTPEPSKVDPAPVAPVVENEPDFRDREPVAEIFGGVGFLEDSQKEWFDRNDEDEEKPTSPYYRGEEEEEEDDLLTDRGLFRRSPPSCDGGVCPSNPTESALGDRIADRAARSFLQGITPKLDQAKQEAFRKFDKLGEDAKDALEERLADELRKARAELEKNLDKELGALKAVVVKELKAKLRVGLTFFVIIVGSVALAVVWIEYNATLRKL